MTQSHALIARSAVTAGLPGGPRLKPEVLLIDAVGFDTLERAVEYAVRTTAEKARRLAGERLEEAV